MRFAYHPTGGFITLRRRGKLGEFTDSRVVRYVHNGLAQSKRIAVSRITSFGGLVFCVVPDGFGSNGSFTDVPTISGITLFCGKLGEFAYSRVVRYVHNCLTQSERVAVSRVTSFGGLVLGIVPYGF